MDQSFISTIAVVVITAVISNYVTYFFTRKMQLEAEWRKDKLVYYNQLIDSITETMSMPKDNRRTYNQYTHTYNAVSLIAPQYVSNIVFEFYSCEQRFWEQDDIDEEHDKFDSDMKTLLQRLILAIRKDLRIKPKDDPETFKYKLRSAIITE